ncbi:MAG TPA: 50S ribosomal protein L10 [Candidatus Saccharimonadales bacterium]|nr:50S ribosomal protein L10 [Candidatus Saccharimonadales bacterium]
MALSREKKEEAVSEVTQLLKDSKLTVVAKYQGTSVKSMQELRRASRDNGTRVLVVKNRLFKKAAAGDERFKDTDLSELNGQLMYAFNNEDEVAPAQSLANFAKNEPQIEFVAALTPEGKLLPAEEVKVLASLPSKNELIAQTVAMLLSPVNDVTNALSGNLYALLDGVEAKATA